MSEDNVEAEIEAELNQEVDNEQSKESETKGFIDARCTNAKCGKKIGWFGTMLDHPACPRCGHKPDPKALESDAKYMDELCKLIATHPKNAKGKLARQRTLAGLSLLQAANRLGIHDWELTKIENGDVLLSEELANKMAEIYDCG